MPPEAARLLEDGLGGVCLFGSNTADGFEAVRRLTDAVHAANPVAVVAIDEEGGDVTRLHARAGSPHLGAAALGVLDDLAVTEATGWAVGRALADAGIDLDLAPVADVNSCADNPVIGTRSFGADPTSAAAHVAAWATGLQAAGVAACVKHFPGHGDTHEDSHLGLPVVDVDLETLHRRELVPFAAAVRQGVAAVMTSHLVVPALDPERPATMSRRVLDLLRDNFGFAGVIVTDALDMAGASAGRGIPEAAVLSLAAGADLLCLGPDKDADLVLAVRDAIVAAVAGGRLTEERLARGGRAQRPAAATSDARPWTRARRPVRLGPRRRRLPSLAGAVVLLVDTPGTIAVGDVPWGLPADVVVDPAASDPLAALSGSAPLVVQVRDAHRQHGVRRVLAAVADTGREAVVVEWGWPGPATTGLPRICTHGWSLPGARAVTDCCAVRGGTDDRPARRTRHRRDQDARRRRRR